RIAVNRSNGHGEDILRVASLLFERDFDLTEFYPGAMVLTVTEPVDAVPALEHEMMEDAAAGGVRIDVHCSEDEQADLFRGSSLPGVGEAVFSGVVSDHFVTGL